MVIKAAVIARFNTAHVSFARVVLKGQPEMKNSGAFKFLDIKDDGELSIGDKIEVTITRVVATPEITVFDAFAVSPAAISEPHEMANLS